MTSLLEQAAKDLCIPPQGSHVVLAEKPPRWDEYLDLTIPILILHNCGELPTVLNELWHAGLGNHVKVRLVREDGSVRALSVDSEPTSLESSPSPWVLALNWSHPNEGWRAKCP